MTEAHKEEDLRTSASSVSPASSASSASSASDTSSAAAVTNASRSAGDTPTNPSGTPSFTTSTGAATTNSVRPEEILHATSSGAYAPTGGTGNVPSRGETVAGSKETTEAVPEAVAEARASEEAEAATGTGTADASASTAADATKSTAAAADATASAAAVADAKEAEAGTETELLVQAAADLVLAQAEAEEWKGKYLRLHAEWDTYRRRTAEQRAEEKACANEKLVEHLLPMIDDFERTIDYAKKNGESGLLGGVEAVHTKLIDTLVKEGVIVLDPKGEAFDALECQAISTIEDKTVCDETVADVLQKGYKMGKKVLRPAMVIVATGGTKREPAPKD